VHRAAPCRNVPVTFTLDISMTTAALQLFEGVLSRAFAELDVDPVPVYTFALYHDHESEAVSVCVDTEENSRAVVAAINRYNAKYFLSEIKAGSLKGASLWQANVGRSLSLGDFARVNLARTSLDGLVTDAGFYLEMGRAVCSAAQRVAARSPDPSRVVFACSGENDEVALVWALPADA